MEPVPRHPCEWMIKTPMDRPQNAHILNLLPDDGPDAGRTIFVTISEIARQAGVSRSTIRRHASMGAIRYRRWMTEEEFSGIVAYFIKLRCGRDSRVIRRGLEAVRRASNSIERLSMTSTARRIIEDLSAIGDRLAKQGIQAGRHHRDVIGMGRDQHGPEKSTVQEAAKVLGDLPDHEWLDRPGSKLIPYGDWIEARKLGDIPELSKPERRPGPGRVEPSSPRASYSAWLEDPASEFVGYSGWVEDRGTSDEPDPEHEPPEYPAMA
jgi:hypothetical protein